MKELPIYVRPQKTMFTHWTETLYICLSDDGDMWLKVWNVGDCGSGETFKSQETKEMSELYTQIQELCHEKDWDFNEVLHSIPNEESGLAMLLGTENIKVVTDRDAEEEFYLMASQAIKSVIYPSTDLGASNERAMHEKIQLFVMKYLKLYKSLPTGDHFVGDIKVTFPQAYDL